MTVETNVGVRPIPSRRLDYVVKRHGCKLLQAIIADGKSLSVMTTDDGKHGVLYVNDKAMKESPWLDYRMCVVAVDDNQLTCADRKKQRTIHQMAEFDIQAVYEQFLTLLCKHDMNGKATIWLLDRYVMRDFLFEDLDMVNEEIRLFKKIYPTENLDLIKTRKEQIEKVTPHLLVGSSVGVRHDKLSELGTTQVSISSVNTPTLVGYVYFLHGFAASKVFSQCTRWCTTTSLDQFEYYSSKGLIVVDVIHTTTKEQLLSQLSPGSSNWLNEKDSAMTAYQLKQAIHAIRSMVPTSVASSYNTIKREASWWILTENPNDKSEILTCMGDSKKLIRRLESMYENTDQPIGSNCDPIDVLNGLCAEIGMPIGSSLPDINEACTIDPKLWLRELNRADTRFALKNVIVKLDSADDRIIATLELIKDAINDGSLSSLSGQIDDIKQQNIELMFDYYLKQVVSMSDIVQYCTATLHQELELIRLRARRPNTMPFLDLFGNTTFTLLFASYCYARGYVRLEPKNQLVLSSLIVFGVGSGDISENMRQLLLNRFYDSDATVLIDSQCTTVPNYVKYGALVTHMNSVQFDEYDAYVESPQIEVLMAAYIRAYVGVHGSYGMLVQLLSRVKPARMKHLIQKLGTSVTMFEFSTFPEAYAKDIDLLFNKCVESSSPPYGTPTHWLTIELSHYDKLVILLALGCNLYQGDVIEVHSTDYQWLNINGTLFKDVPELQAAAFNMSHNKVMNRDVFANNVRYTVEAIAQRTVLRASESTRHANPCMGIHLPWKDAPSTKHRDINNKLSLYIQRLFACKNAKVTIPVTGVVSSPDWLERIDERFSDLHKSHVDAYELREKHKLSSARDNEIDHDNVTTVIRSMPDVEMVNRVINTYGSLTDPHATVLLDTLTRR